MFSVLRESHNLQVCAIVFGIMVLCISVIHLRYMLLESVKPKVKTAMIASMFGIYILVVLFLAVYFCTFATTMEQCFYAWALAFMSGNFLAIFQACIIYVCRRKRTCSELDKMKLQDI